MNKYDPKNSIISAEKIRDYLLSAIHPIGKFKAKFFFSLGYSQEEWERLANDIEKILLEGQITGVEDTIYGRKYIISGQIKTPSGNVSDIVTVWIMRKGENIFRFITAYPGEKK